MMISLRRAASRFFVGLFIISSQAAFAEPQNTTNSLHIHVDAARSGAAGDSGRAIEYGIRVALESLDNKLGDCPVSIIVADHRGSSVKK